MDKRDQRLQVEAGGLKALIEAEIRFPLGANKIWVAIDEAQKCPALFDQIKVIYDEYKDQDLIKFILTGSGLLTLHQLTAESLAGRIELHYLREFNLSETLRLQNDEPYPAHSFFDELLSFSVEKIEKHIKTLRPLHRIVEQSLSDQLVWGGLPEALNETSTDSRREYLSNYLQTYLEKDIRAISNISDLNLYQKLMTIIAEQTGSVKQDNEITEAINCSRDTLKKYRGYLLATLMYKELYPFIGSSLKRLVKSPKGYLVDNGLISYLTGIDDFDLLGKTGLIGHRFENWFLKELQIWLDRQTKRSDIYYWRTSGGVEVDFVVEIKPEVFPFEVTYSRKIQPRKIKSLIQFMKDEPGAKIGFYIYMGDFAFDHEKNIMFIPAWAIN